MFSTLPLIVLVLLTCNGIENGVKAENYWGYKVYDVVANSTFEKNVLLHLSSNDNYDFFIMPRKLGKAARVMIRPEDQLNFEDLLTEFGINFNVINHNIGKQLIIDRRSNYQLQKANNYDFKTIDLTQRHKSRISFDDFQRHDKINTYLEELQSDFPNLVKVSTLGHSYEERPIKAITITNGDGNLNKKVILIDAGIHAREWIAPAQALYVIHQLVENYAANSHLLIDYDWVILPMVNPDGYEFTHTTSRFWRKTRRPISGNCFGTDGNRNFDFHWGEIGASNQSCSETFHGEKAFSEPETQIVRDLMLSLSGRAKMYLTLHSYGNYLLYPWGWTSDLPKTWKDIDMVAKVGAAAVKAITGTEYTVGSSTNVLYAAAGGSDDYAYARANIPVAITMELPAGGTGFDPPPIHIKPFVKEGWIGIKEMANFVIRKY